MNSTDLWQKLLSHLDEMMQLGLLNRLRETSSRRFEGKTLYITPSTPDNKEYLNRSDVLHQLQLIAQDCCGIEKVVIE